MRESLIDYLSFRLLPLIPW